MEEKINSVSPESLSLLQECWKEITGVQPKQDDDYTEVYCRDESPYILVNMVHDCFLRSFVKVRVEAIMKNQTEKVDRMEIVKRLYLPVDELFGPRMCNQPHYLYHNLPKSQILEFVKCMDVGPNLDISDFQFIEDDLVGPMGLVAVEYFKTIYQLDERIWRQQDNNNRSYCQDDLDQATEQIQCLKEFMQKNVTILQKCFKDITWLSSQFPESDAQIKSYLCDNKLSYPMALMKKVEECAVRRTLLPGQRFEVHEATRCISLPLLDDKDDDDYSRFIADDIEIVYHNNMCQGNNVSALKEHIFQNPSTNRTACVFDKFKKESFRKSNVVKVIDYCWNFLMSHGQFVNSTVSEVPNSDEKWMKFYCSHDYYNKRMALPSFQPVNSCLERMLRLDSRSVSKFRIFRWDSKSEQWIEYSNSNPRRSEDEEALMRCLEIDDFQSSFTQFQD